MDRPATLTDVARLAGVHPSTVSRVVSRPDIVAASTRERVEEAIAQLDFVPNRLARGLVRGRTGAFGFLVPDIANPYFAAIIQAAQDEARQHDVMTIVADTRHDPAEEQRAVATLRTNVDGLVICSPVAPGRFSNSVPTVYVNRQAAGVASVIVDQAQIVELAIGHLVALGHRRLAVFNGPRSYWSSGARSRALSSMLGQRGLAGISVTEIADLDPTFEGGWKATDQAVAAGVTGVCAFNDVMALGAVASAAASGLSVPDDLSVVGSDGVAMAGMARPPLTTVASPLDELGRAAIRLLVGAEETAPAAELIVQPTLVVRESTGPAAGGVG